MFLKRLVLNGFKSFADKTLFDFDRPVTGIVGPNGCGKSNLVDAVRWVLGEQSAKTLRGKQMLDVIFNGSGTRRSSGMSQVDLVFDNHTRLLPTDAEEVVISRRLYRSGESEYLVNKQVCRLRDVRELFLDTGVGQHAYSIIEQGRVDAMLQANPQDRRAFFEEAAGIARYKARRKEAERKLERVGQNLLRVTDIIEELESRLRKVRVQATRARHYQEYSQRLCELRSRYALEEYHKHSTAIDELQRAVATLNDELLSRRTQIDSQETEIARLQRSADQLDVRVHQVNGQLVTLQSELATHEERAESSRRRIEEHRQNLSEAGDRLAAEQKRRDELARRLEMENAEAERLQDEATRQDDSIAELRAADEQLARTMAETQARLEDEKAGVLDLFRETSRLSNEINTLRHQQESLTGQRDRLSARDAAIREELTGLLSQRMQLQDRRGQIERLIAAETQRWEQKKSDAANLEATRSSLAEQLAEDQQTRAALVTRKNLLEELERTYEGVDQAVRTVLQRRDQDEGGRRFEYVQGMVAELLEADVEHAELIEAALNGFDQYLVVTDRERLLADHPELIELGGRVRAFCLDRLGPFIEPEEMAAQPGVVGRADQWVSAPESCEWLVRQLLGRVIVVQTLDDARRLAEQDTRGLSFLTMAGDLLAPSGKVSMGKSRAHSGLISRKSELRELAGEVQRIEARIAQHRDRLNRLDAEAEYLSGLQAELRTAIYEASTAKIENQAELARCEDAVRRLTQEQPLIAGEVEQIEQQLADAAGRDAAHRSALEQLEAQNARREEEVARLRALVDEQVTQRRLLAERLTEARVAAGQIAEKRAALARLIASLTQSRDAAQAAVEDAERQAEAARLRIEDAERTILAAEQQQARLSLAQQRLSAEGIALRRERTLIDIDREHISARIKMLRDQIDALSERLHQQDMQLNETRVRREELLERIRDELKIDLAEQYVGYRPGEEDWAAVEAEIDELRGKLERLGSVNLEAIDEQKEVEDRLSFLTTQRDDLESSRKQLEELIVQLNDESRSRFEAVFLQVRDNFKEIFRKLFGGGRADLILEDPTDVLESGVEIVASPAGKQLTSIAPLSGGEKALTAIALLMAIFRAKPSPFCILDEVDAPLDDANVERFAGLVREYSDSSQFIVVTHNKRTMSAANVLYGITMQEPGVSTPVSVKFDDQPSDELAAAAAG